MVSNRIIHFLGSTSSNYLFGKGRGKDKKKRKSRIINALKGAGAGLLATGTGLALGLKGSKIPLRQKILKSAGTLGVSTLIGAGVGNALLNREKRTPLTDAKDFVVGGKKFLKESNIKNPKDLFDTGIQIYNRKRDSSSVATVPLATLGTVLAVAKPKKTLGILGASNAVGLNPVIRGYTGGMTALSVGLQADKQISKEKARYRKEGARSRFGKIVNDTNIGVKSTAGILAANQAVTQTVKSFAKRNGLPIKTKLLGALGAGVGGAIYGGAKGAAIGGSVGAGIGTARGFVQKNKKGKKSRSEARN